MPAQIVNAALEESVHVVGGIIPAEDEAVLKEPGRAATRLRPGRARPM